MSSNSNIVNTALSVLSTLALVFALSMLFGCSSSPTVVASTEDSAPTEQQEKQPNESVAASTGDISVTEQEVDDYISQYRAYIGAEEDAAFATLLDEAGQTPETIRKQAIETLLAQRLLRAETEEAGISIADEDIDAYIQDVRDGLGYVSDDGWKSVLDITGYDDLEAYRYDVETKLLLESMLASKNGDMSASEVEMIVLADANPSDYTGAYLVEAVFPSSASYKASRFMGQMEGKTLDEFREETAAAVEAGNAEEIVEAGWTCLDSNFSGAAVEALEKAVAGDIVMWQEDNGGYVVAYVSEVFYPLSSGRVDYASMPDEIRRVLASDASKQKRANLSSSYMKGLIDSADISMSDMPSDASYNVDMTLSSYGEDSTLSEDEISESISNQISALESAGNE